MKPSQTIALDKAIKEKAQKEARTNLTPGQHAVDFAVRITGTISVGESYEQQIVAKCDAWSLLAVAMSKLNGVTLGSIVREAESADGAEIKAQAAAAISKIKAATVTPCSGKIKTDLRIVTVGG